MSEQKQIANQSALDGAKNFRSIFPPTLILGYEKANNENSNGE